MYGAIIGDIAGSSREFQYPPQKSKDFKFFVESSFFTDDTIMACAIAKSLIEAEEQNRMFPNIDIGAFGFLPEIATKNMLYFGNEFPNFGYGHRFSEWLYSKDPKPYNSFGNGAAMRVSPVGWFAESESVVKELSRLVTIPTHNHPEGIKGAECVALCVFWARKGLSQDEIRRRVHEDYYRMDFTLDEIRPGYFFDETCQGSIPQALMSFFEAENYEDAVRNAISLGGDADTLAAIAGSIAEPYFGIPTRFIEMADGILTKYPHAKELKEVVDEFVFRFVLRGKL